LLTRGSTTSGFLLGLAITAVIAALAWWLVPGSGVRIDTSRPAVVQRIQQLERLETVVYWMDKIVAGGQESRHLPRLLAGDRLLLIVYGEVTAGVDLGKIESSQIEVTGRATAATNARATLSTFLPGLGFDRVVVR
jgi:hypothetical protein